MIQDETLLVYKDDDNSVKKIYVKVISLTDGFITFQTIHNGTPINEITLPNHRIIKIKKSIGEQNDKQATRPHE